MKPILFYDTETSGLPDWKKPSGGPSQPHIVQLAALFVDADTQEVLSEMNSIVKPDGWVITPELTAIHGISYEQAMEEGEPERAVLNRFLILWNRSNRVAHNRTFDQRIIRIALKRYSDKETTDAWAEKEDHKCTMLMAKPIMKMRPKNNWGFKSPKLEEAYKYFTGKDLEGAHDAMIDVNACMEIYFKICEHNNGGNK